MSGLKPHRQKYLQRIEQTGTAKQQGHLKKYSNDNLKPFHFNVNLFLLFTKRKKSAFLLMRSTKLLQLRRNILIKHIKNIKEGVAKGGAAVG